MFNLIVAYDSDFGIGKNNKIPWHFPEDLKFFKEITSEQVIIMGRVTFESIIAITGGPLKNRFHIVISSQEQKNTENVIFVQSPKHAVELFAFEFAKKYKGFVIGGAKIYDWFVDHGYVRTEFRTEIFGKYDCDTFYKQKNIVRTNEEVLLQSDKLKIVKSTIGKNEEEREFLRLGKKILENGDFRHERTGAGAYSLFGHQLHFDLRNNTFPLLTTRKMFLTGIFEELMFYLRGQTDNQILESKGVKVWTANTTREFLDSRGLQHLPIGDMGPSYGFLFRHFGASYENCKTNYKGQGQDQLADLIKKIKTNPTDRRLIISLWDPINKDKCPLPPCLYNYQFYVRDKYLSCMMTQRSSDYAVAGGWNVATGALFVILLAVVCGLEPETLIWNIGDAHLYANVVDGFKIQLERTPRPFPKLFVKLDVDLHKRSNALQTNKQPHEKPFEQSEMQNKQSTELQNESSLEILEKIQKENLFLVGYESQEAIKFHMNA
jgi:thymidylate synthase